MHSNNRQATKIYKEANSSNENESESDELEDYKKKKDIFESDHESLDTIISSDAESCDSQLSVKKTINKSAKKSIGKPTKKLSRKILKTYDKDAIQNIIFEDINDVYAYGKYGDFNVIIMKDNGYINATKLCKDAHKDKK